jgi:hypothetical protein
MLSHQVLVGRDLSSLLSLSSPRPFAQPARARPAPATATPARETNAARRSFCIIAKSRQLGSLFARKRLIAWSDATRPPSRHCGDGATGRQIAVTCWVADAGSFASKAAATALTSGRACSTTSIVPRLQRIRPSLCSCFSGASNPETFAR